MDWDQYRENLKLNCPQDDNIDTVNDLEERVNELTLNIPYRKLTRNPVPYHNLVKRSRH